MQNLKFVSKTNVREALVCKGDEKTFAIYSVYQSRYLAAKFSIFNVKWTNIWTENNSDNINTRQIE